MYDVKKIKIKVLLDNMNDLKYILYVYSIYLYDYILRYLIWKINIPGIVFFINHNI